MPIVDWLPHCRRAWLSRDLIAGVTVWAVLVPESIAYASIAGVPAQYGPYTALGAATAIVYLLLGVFRMGWASNFLASPVLEEILGAARVEGSYWAKLIGTLKEAPQTDLSTLAVGGTAVALLLVMRFFAPRLPRAIMVVILGATVVPLFDLTSRGVTVVGDLPSGLPSLTLPTGLSLDQWGGLLVGSLAVVFVGFSESIAAVSSMAAKHGEELSTDQELIALGGAHIGSALLGGFPVSGSLSKTSVADAARGRRRSSACSSSPP